MRQVSTLLRSRANTKIQAHNKTDDDNNGQTDEESPPLQLPRSSGMLDTLVKLHVSGFGVLLHVFRMLLGRLNWLFLEYDSGGEIFHELIQFYDCAFDLLDVVVTGSYGA